MKNFICMAMAVWAVAWVSYATDITSAPASYQIRNCKFDELLRPKDANNADGVHLVLYPAQPWKCMTWKLQPMGDSKVQLQNHFTHKTFEVQKSGTHPVVVQIPFDRDAAKRSVWKLEKLPNGFYRISDVATGQALTAISKNEVVLTAGEEKPEQQWDLIETDPATLTM